MWRSRSAWGLIILLFVCLPECRPESPSAEQSFETELLMLTNLHRSSRGLPILAADEKLAAIARLQSDGMARQGFISHEVPSGDLRSRMQRAGYLHEIARENVANARTVAVAQQALLQSPAHEENILADDVTRIGIGIVRHDDRLFVTEIFASPRKPYNVAAVRELLVDRLKAMRPDPKLERLASQSVQSLRVPVDRSELQEVLALSAAELRRDARTGLSRVDISVQLLNDPRKVKIPGQTERTQSLSYGSAVRQIVNAHNEPAFLVLTLIGVEQE